MASPSIWTESWILTYQILNFVLIIAWHLWNFWQPTHLIWWAEIADVSPIHVSFDISLQLSPRTEFTFSSKQVFMLCVHIVSGFYLRERVQSQVLIHSGVTTLTILKEVKLRCISEDLIHYWEIANHCKPPPPAHQRRLLLRISVFWGHPIPYHTSGWPWRVPEGTRLINFQITT